MITEEELKGKLINNDDLFEKIVVFNADFDIVPHNGNHMGAYITIRDTKELRDQFLGSLYDTIVEYVYSKDKYCALVDREINRSNKSMPNAFSYVQRKAAHKFRGKFDDNNMLIQGQLGELLLFHFIQRFKGAVPLLRKMPVTTSDSLERNGCDAIHYKYENKKNIFYLGEAKTYSSKYKFKTAFKEALESITTTYMNIDDELKLYVSEDFLDKDLNDIADDFIEGRLPNSEIYPVIVIIYNENNKRKGDNEDSIKREIENIIKKRFKDFDDNLIDIKNPVIQRITFIVFPIWRLDDLVEKFQKMIVD
ncbi:HamA C-terminal domain-containing protein [Pseudobutyrivibrio ruminis]|uniref:Anti-bacteriophage protein A/HamA C-terminal domain-containing protein n=1 Tax=Pseudobutyrivibrio ruminis DSM 9787 TaxID=1123011 RepID=A0A285RF93_9FIRM|nr:DUF1837 domain-containing protein [Pseudobutyrivibrio ruminis]SOB92584.1 protein of unknown function [Pseudobutyrivibrio ruminis DSM 9787]